ncbi:glycosyltransferase [Clostridium perfringens]|nr:glycosyltransferase [Clostridium perfringens]
MKVVFLVLHYKTLEVTKRCVNSIIKYKDCEVVIMDNGSNNSSGERLVRYYESNENVHVIVSKENWGFSKGNNYAYQRMREMGIYPDFLIACNNDLIFEQKDFIYNLINVYNNKEAAIIGPDIKMYGNQKVHQNPLMLRARTLEEIKNYKEEINKKLNKIKYILIKQYIKNIISIVFKRKINQVNLPKFDYNNECENVCLCGACLIFTPNFFKKYKSGLFKPETNFYHEEEILFYRLKKNNDFMLYTPKLTVIHDHSVSTSEKFSNQIERLKFQYYNNLNSCNILIDFINK